MGKYGLITSAIILSLFIYSASLFANNNQLTTDTSTESCQTKLKPLRFNEFDSDQSIVLDTNILVNDPDSFQHFGKANVIIPMTVINELGKFKTEEYGSRGRAARQFYRDFYNIVSRHPDPNAQIYPTRDGGTVTIEFGEKTSGELLAKLHEDTNDSRIIQSAFKLNNDGKKFCLSHKMSTLLLKPKLLEFQQLNTSIRIARWMKTHHIQA